MPDESSNSPESPIAPNNRLRSRIVFLVRATVVLLLFALPCFPIIAIAVDVFNSKRKRHRFLHETDHQALLMASRQLIRDYAGQQISEPANDPRVPLIIRGLVPSYMDISAEQLRVELHGGFDHYGFFAYPEGANIGDKRGKLIDGLFFYSD